MRKGKKTRRPAKKVVRKRGKAGTARNGGQSAGERTLNALLRSGSTLLAKKGLANISLRMIARHAGYSATLVYKHFPDKYALFQAIREVEFRAYVNDLQLLYQRCEDPVERIFAMAQAALAFSEDRGVAFGFDFLSASSQSYPAGSSRSQRTGFESSTAAGEVEKLVIAAVDEYFKTLPRYPLDAFSAAHLIFAAVFGVTALPVASVNGSLPEKTPTLMAMVTALMEHWKALSLRAECALEPAA
jgi:AcrR family transcriptional regulator